MQDVPLTMNYATARGISLELPGHISPTPQIDTIIDLLGQESQAMVPRARVIIAKNPPSNPTYLSKRTTCHYLLGRLLNSISAEEKPHRKLCYTTAGAPFLAGHDKQHLSVSMARTGDWLAAGVSYAAQIGIDIEFIKWRANFQKTAEFLNWNVPATDIQDFYANWTLWEASAKCVEGSVFMGNNQGFEHLCHIDTSELVSCSGQWHGLQGIIDDSVSYAVVLRCQSGVSLSHRIHHTEEPEVWPMRFEALPDIESDKLH